MFLSKRTLPIFSNKSTSSLFISHISLGIGLRNMAPERWVTGRPLLYWYMIKSLIVGKAGPSNL